MDKIDQLYKAKALLNQAMIAASSSMPNNKDIMEARQHIKRAMTNLDNASKGHIRKKQMNQGQFEQWWGNVQSGVANASYSGMSQESRVRSLAALDAMISEEQRKLNALEAQAQVQKTEVQPVEQYTDQELLSD